MFLLLFSFSPFLRAFDSHEHVYLGECVKLQYVGDDSAYKEKSNYHANYEVIKQQRNLVGDLCDQARKDQVYRVKLNRFNFKEHDVLNDLEKFKKFRHDASWHTISAGNEDDSWSVGEVISIAGDYIGLTKEDHPNTAAGVAPAISDPLFRGFKTGEDSGEETFLKRAEETAQNVLKAFNYMKQWGGNPFFDTQIGGKDLTPWFREFIKKELETVAEIHTGTQQKVTFDSSSHREMYVNHKRVIKQIQSSAGIPLPYQNLDLLSANVDHFAPDAQYVYQIGHNLACSFAISAKDAKTTGADEATVNRILSEAYGIEAFVSHYLSDLFSAGHTRSPRRAAKHLGKAENWAGLTLDVVGNLDHDVDGWLGLKVCSGVNCEDEWISYGDNALFDIKSKTNREKAIETLQKGFDQVWTCYNSTI